MKLHYSLFLIGYAFAVASCTKGAKDVITTTPVAKDTMPLANTVNKTDTLKVMAYNVLNYGDGCQGNISTLNAYFKTIIQYTQPDLLSCEKMNSFAPAPGAAGNLADEITNHVLNIVFPDQYAYAMPTNTVFAGNMSVLFYNKQKLTYVYTKTLVAAITDFDLYKLYYNDVNLSITHDTTFLYVVVNHTQSGSSSTTRDQQVTMEMQALRNKFRYLPNLINMGDFNTRNSFEDGYQAIISSKDSATMMSDPPFYPDGNVHYPANWDVNPALFPSYLTTSTRMSASIPNTCGTSGGAKSWYDHIFISPWLVNGANYIKYIPNSYQTTGNDGNRLGADINSNSPAANNAAPAPVINALFQLSNKYPVTIKLAVKANRNANSPADPAEIN
ncbi:hypothetical protein CLV51_102819 [Chitinophaga niastensis]|uniref:Endonuclease/exonuclease/phosphatase family protein n=1 Tax=Chitinophaga niastensis TaxID=536980 RepID=A0A2P8HP09_CHINA|nr:hypothetical protein [Chitinophaga niastensis]PSL47959.1 hypothetical protein CLV51_102819 [Chitinophaga niastensis]